MGGYKYFEFVEKHAGVLGIAIAIMVSLGGLAEITPLFMQAQKIQPADGIKPYDALRLAGRDVYVREGCYLCHSQMIRALRFETERYGKYSIASESVYDRPFQWGSKRTGLFRRLAASAPARSALAGPGVQHACVSVVGDQQDRRGGHPGAHAHATTARRSL
jgi:hypothetical protein